MGGLSCWISSLPYSLSLRYGVVPVWTQWRPLRDAIGLNRFYLMG